MKIDGKGVIWKTRLRFPTTLDPPHFIRRFSARPSDPIKSITSSVEKGSSWAR
jgi:hypothetical protein